MPDTKLPYPDVNANPDFPALEREILALWKKEGTFQRSIDQRPAPVFTNATNENAASRPGEPSAREAAPHASAAARSGDSNQFVFYDGPPFANGLPHYGHLLTGFVKDAIARYQTMRGKRVERRFGWDCHGLPAEMGSEKELGISGRQAIIQFGIEKFNEHCRTSVMKYTSEWEQYVTRQARWVDFKNDYKTMDISFMESVLWAFSELYKKGLVYEAHRVMPYSWAAETPLSNFETKLDNSYREREDKAITVAFELNERPEGAPDAEKYYVLAWTTTPWTLPSNLALAVGKEVEYAYVIKEGNAYIASKNMLSKASEFALKDAEGKNTPPDLWPLASGQLIGLTYKPLFPYFADTENAFRILDGSSFVSDGDGTGVVHIAPGFGEDDKRVADENGIPTVVPVDEKGKYTDAIFDLPDLQLKGLNVIAEKVDQFKFGEANERIIKWLKDHGQLIKQEQIKHNYPHCWRTDQPLIYRAMPSWYVNVQQIKDNMAANNQTINWIPDHVQSGQMGKGIESAPDWSISRNRFWGTPIPIWRGDKGNLKVFGSIAELEAFFGQKVHDLHRPFIDELVKTDEHGETFKRVEDVFDCWFESGSMPYAQLHYPFTHPNWDENAARNPEWSKNNPPPNFPADFITEYIAQTRGWFYTLQVLSAALFGCAPFKNVICHGVVLGEPVKDPNTGKMVNQKLSKRLKNYPEPNLVFDEYGADALRWFMLSSSVMRGGDMIIDKEGKFIRDVVRLAVKPIWNAYNFFCLYANADGIKVESVILSGSEGSPSTAGDSSAMPQNDINVMDRYILAKCALAVSTIQTSLDAYDTPGATEAVLQFFEVLNNWYIRRSKERFWAEEKSPDKQAAYDTLYSVLVTMCKAAAPLLPLTLEKIYRDLTGEPSVHLADFPTSNKESKKTLPNELSADEVNIALMDWTQNVCNAAHAIRNRLNIRVRQPLDKLIFVGSYFQTTTPSSEYYSKIIEYEVNVKHITSEYDVSDYATLKLSINSQVLGKRLPAKMKEILPLSKKGEWKQENGAVMIAGEKLLPEEYTLLLEPKAEFKDRAQALSTNDALVILDTHITPELKSEGIARDMVRAIQQARKDANLNVSDRIQLHIDAPAKTLAAIEAHKTYILEQTLATELLAAAPAQPLFQAQNAIDSNNIVISLVKA